MEDFFISVPPTSNRSLQELSKATQGGAISLVACCDQGFRYLKEGERFQAGDETEGLHGWTLISPDWVGDKVSTYGALMGKVRRKV
jgi:hypothetical protein